MADRITPEQFAQSDGVGDWRVRDSVASTVFNTKTFSAGAAFVSRIAAIADELNHHPDVDLRYPSVTIRLTTHDAGGLTARDVELARRISGLARELGHEADPPAG